MNIKEIESEIERLKKLHEEIKARAEKLTPAQRVAELLHAKQCRASHEDQCGWHYESWDKMGFSRNEWHERAVRALESLSEKEIEKALEVLL
jgi:hypothetical protein